MLKFKCECGNTSRIISVDKEIRYTATIKENRITYDADNTESNLVDGIYCEKCDKYLATNIPDFVRLIKEGDEGYTIRSLI